MLNTWHSVVHFSCVSPFSFLLKKTPTTFIRTTDELIRQSKNYYLLIRSINLRFLQKAYGFHIHVHRKHIIMVILVFFKNSFCLVYGDGELTHSSSWTRTIFEWFSWIVFYKWFFWLNFNILNNDGNLDIDIMILYVH